VAVIHTRLDTDDTQPLGMVIDRTGHIGAWLGAGLHCIGIETHVCEVSFQQIHSEVRTSHRNDGLVLFMARQ
jgi:hypothetical protein